MTFTESLLRVTETVHSEGTRRDRRIVETPESVHHFRIWIDGDELTGTFEGTHRELHFALAPAPLSAEEFRSFELGDEWEFLPDDPAQVAALQTGRAFEQLPRFVGRAEPSTRPIIGKTEKTIRLIHLGETGLMGIWMQRAKSEARPGSTSIRRSVEDVHWRNFFLTPH